MLIGVLMGLVLFGTYQWLPWVFTQDLLVQEGVRSIALQGSVSMVAICAVMALDGITIGLSDWKHLQSTNFAAMVATLAALAANHTVLAGGSLGTVW